MVFMAMTFDIPPDVQASVACIPNLDMRVALYLRHEAQLESARQRHGAEARGIAERAVKQAEKDKGMNAGFEWDQSLAELRRRHEEITSKL